MGQVRAVRCSHIRTFSFYSFVTASSKFSIVLATFRVKAARSVTSKCRVRARFTDSKQCFGGICVFPEIRLVSLEG